MSRFRPMVSRRVPSGTHFAELFLSPGPEAIGVTGDNSYATMYGFDWLLVWDRDDGLLHLWQERDGAWHEVVDDLPPVFAAPAPVGSRRWSLAFDQAARVVLAYEDDTGVVRVTRWDASSNAYVQNVSFSGHDPCVVIDASWSRNIPDSDVLLFYLSPDRERLMCRVQRDVYATAYELHDFVTPVILDRVIAAPLRYQVLVSDATGAPLPQMLLSDRYPYLTRDAAAVTGAAREGQYAFAAYFAEVVEEFATAGLPLDGEYVSPVLYADRIVENELTTAGLPLDGEYVSPVLYADRIVEGALKADGLPLDGDYKEVAFWVAIPRDEFDVTGTPLGGTYSL